MFTNYQTFSDAKMTDSKYFTTTKKGEIFELKSELNSDKKERKREAVKKTIANMTVGKVGDMSPNFYTGTCRLQCCANSIKINQIRSNNFVASCPT